MQINEVKWLKFPVGFTTSMACIRMQSAKRSTNSMRDKLMATWFEIFDLAGRLDANGRLIDGERVVNDEDLAAYFHRNKESVSYCMEWYLSAGLLTIDGETGAYYLVGWEENQSTETMKRLRKKREDKPCDAPDEEDPENTADAEETREEDVTEENRKEENKKENNRINKNKIESAEKREDASALGDAREEEKREEETENERFERMRQETIEAYQRHIRSEELGKAHDPDRRRLERLSKEYFS